MLNGIEPPVIEIRLVFQLSPHGKNPTIPLDTKNKDDERLSTAISSKDEVNTRSPTTTPTSTPTNNVIQGQHNITMSPPVNSTTQTSDPSLSPSTTVIHSFTSMPPTTGSFVHEKTALKTSINEKGFLKIDSIKMRDV